MKYVDAIRSAIFQSMKSNTEMMILGQGVWSPFYVGSSMDGIEREFGRERVLDTPVSENAVTGMGVGLALSGIKTLIIHPRIDFILYAMDPLVNSAAKWRYSLNLGIQMPLTVRAIINRGGEQGAQHSQALHSWFSHIPGLRVVMPSSPEDAYILLRESINSPDPVIFIEDRWDYDENAEFDLNCDLVGLDKYTPKKISFGDKLTVVGIGHTTNIVRRILNQNSILSGKVDLIDLRILNPLNVDLIVESIKVTGKLLVVDGGWSNCGMAGEIIARTVLEDVNLFKKSPVRLTLKDTPAPTSSILEAEYYINDQTVLSVIEKLIA